MIIHALAARTLSQKEKPLAWVVGACGDPVQLGDLLRQLIGLSTSSLDIATAEPSLVVWAGPVVVVAGEVEDRHGTPLFTRSGQIPERNRLYTRLLTLRSRIEDVNQGAPVLTGVADVLAHGAFEKWARARGILLPVTLGARCESR